MIEIRFTEKLNPDTFEKVRETFLKMLPLNRYEIYTTMKEEDFIRMTGYDSEICRKYLYKQENSLAMWKGITVYLLPDDVSQHEIAFRDSSSSEVSVLIQI